MLESRLLGGLLWGLRRSRTVRTALQPPKLQASRSELPASPTTSTFTTFVAAQQFWADYHISERRGLRGIDHEVTVMDVIHPRADWETVGDKWFRKTQNYTAVFDQDLDLDNYIVVGAPYAGAIGMSRTSSPAWLSRSIVQQQ